MNFPTIDHEAPARRDAARRHAHQLFDELGNDDACELGRALLDVTEKVRPRPTLTLDEAITDGIICDDRHPCAGCGVFHMPVWVHVDFNEPTPRGAFWRDRAEYFFNLTEKERAQYFKLEEWAYRDDTGQ